MHNAEVLGKLIERCDFPASGCWTWTGAASHMKYGNVWIDGRVVVAHRAAYAACFGDIPSGKQIHHVCRNTRCVNPLHLDAVTPKEHPHVEPTSCANRTHCPSGHPYDEANTIRRMAKGSNGVLYMKRFCRACKAADERRRKARRAHQVPAGK